MSILRSLVTSFDDDDSQSKWRRFLGVSVVIGAAAITLGANRLLATVAHALVLSGASLFVGILTGFIFGIPKTSRSKGDSTSEADYQSNTNLEDISDWLTKMLVGVGLVELKSVPDMIESIAAYWEKSLGLGSQRAYAAGLVVFFGIVGFLLGYLWTRLALVGDFIAKDPKRLVGALLQKVAAAAQRDPAAGERSPERQIVTATEIEAAQALQAISSTSRMTFEDMRQQLRSLAAQYEVLRATMPAGFERTRKAEIVASQMRAFSLAAYALLPELIKSDSPGERLAAITFLQSRPNRAYFAWLSERLDQHAEKPFVGYQAAVALLNAARSVPASDRKLLEHSVMIALGRTEGLSDSTDRRSVLIAALNALKDAGSAI